MSKRKEIDIYREVHCIKEICMSRVEDLFVQHYHDAGIDELYELYDSFEVDFTTIDDRADDLIFDLLTNFKFRGLSYA
jgi:hypothetical protein